MKAEIMDWATNSKATKPVVFKSVKPVVTAHVLVMLEGEGQKAYRWWWHRGKSISVEMADAIVRKSEKRKAYYLNDMGGLSQPHTKAVHLFDEYCLKYGYDFPIPVRDIYSASEVVTRTSDLVILFLMGVDGDVKEVRVCTQVMLPLMDIDTECLPMTC